MEVEEKREVSPEKFKVLPRHILIDGMIQNDFIITLSKFMSFVTQDIVEHGQTPSYFLVKPKKTWTKNLVFNTTNAVWSDTMDFYIILYNQKNSSDANLLLNTLKHLEAILESNNDYIIFGYYAKKELFDRIGLEILQNIQSFCKIVPSYHFRENLEFKYYKQSLDEKEEMKLWAIYLPDEQNPNNNQLCAIASFQGWHNFISWISPRMFKVTGKLASYEKMVDKKEELDIQLKTKCKILLFCPKCDKYVDNVKFPGTGSKYLCQNLTKNNVKCQGLCIMNKPEH